MAKQITLTTITRKDAIIKVANGEKVFALDFEKGKITDCSKLKIESLTEDKTYVQLN